MIMKAWIQSRHHRLCHPKRWYSADRDKPLRYFGMGGIVILPPAKGKRHVRPNQQLP
jgi:hypothetical protein